MERLHVVAAALLDETGGVLIAERPPGKAMAGRWEFPGGKIAAGETREQALRRELREELGIELQDCEFVMELVHAYPQREVHLSFFVVTAYTGMPQSLDGQQLRWVPIEALHRQDILEADLPFINALQRRRTGARLNP